MGADSRPAAQPARVVRGIVVNDRGPIAGAVVRVRATSISTSTGPDGRFSLTRDAERDGRLALTAWAPGYFCAGLELDETSPREVRIRLREIPAIDNRRYRWLPGTSDAKTEEGQGCAACHRGSDSDSPLRYPVDQWLHDAHSRSARNPLFLSLYAGSDLDGNRSPTTRWGHSRDYGSFPLPPDRTRPYFGPGYKLDFPSTAGNCAACHVPAAAMDAPYGTDPTTVSGVGLEGVTCDFCHKVWAVRLDPKTGLPHQNRPGILSFEFRRPQVGHQYFAGPFDDVPIGDDTFAPVMRDSRFCAPCHFGVFWGTVVYNSFGEWLASPYADPTSAAARSCQDCHMPKGGAEYFVLPEKGGIRRNPATVSTHLMPGVADETFMREAASLVVAAQRNGGGIDVSVSVTNDRAGHHLPTDSPMRHLILVVAARGDGGGDAALVEGPTLPDWTGDVGGRPGRVFAKVLMDSWSQISPVASHWRPTRVVSDTRIAAFATDTSRYRFRAPADGSVVIEARLIYRRAYQELASIKKWRVPDVPMASARVVVGGTRPPGADR